MGLPELKSIARWRRHDVGQGRNSQSRAGKGAQYRLINVRRRFFTVSVGGTVNRIKVPFGEDGAEARQELPASPVVLRLPDVDGPARSSEADVEASAAAAAAELGPVDDVTHNLPVQLTSFIGRDAEIAQVRALLADNRLVTLTGAGGVGKTRLALQVATGVLAEFPAGAWLADLAPLVDAALVPVAVARALGLLDMPGRSMMATVTGFIGERRALLVLDNCEHVLDGCAALAEDLLRACPALVILATSREPVGAAGEVTWRVPSLPVDGAAIELFADRGRRARPGFAVTPENGAAVAEICRRLDGIPLAIELAAARLTAFSPAEIAAGLHDRFRLLTGGTRTAARRQQTLRASVDWSHALLTGPERVLFRRLAAFAGGFDLEAALAVAAGDGVQPDDVFNLLGLLVDKSLVAAEESDGVTRYRLPETVRQYALEMLAHSGEAGQVRNRHCGYYVALPGQQGPAGNADRRHLGGRLDAEIDNLRAAFGWSLEQADRETALRLASSLQPLWLGTFRMLEGLAWFDTALTGQSARALEVAPATWVRAVADAAVLDTFTDTPLRREAQVREALALARELGEPAVLARALVAAGRTAGWLAEAGRTYFAEALALARQAGDPREPAHILERQAFAAYVSGDPVLARSAAEKGLALAEQTGNDDSSGTCRIYLGAALVQQGDLHRARSVLSGLIVEAEAERLPWWKMNGLGHLGMTLALMGHPGEARAAGEASIAIAGEFGLTYLAIPGYGSLCAAAMASGDLDAFYDAIQAFWQRAKTRPEYVSAYHSYLAEAHLAAGELHAAREQADEALSAAASLALKHPLMLALLASARVAAAMGEVARARDDGYHALTVGRNIESQTGIVDALECIGGLGGGAEDQHKAVRILGAADALRRATGFHRFVLHQARYDAAVAKLRTSLGDAAFTEAWDEGAGLTVEDAMNYALRGRGERNRPPIGWLSLTPAEQAVARLVAEGLANKDIALRLRVSPRTVQTHLTHMYGKLGITSRVQLAQQAARHASDP